MSWGLYSAQATASIVVPITGISVDIVDRAIQS